MAMFTQEIQQTGLTALKWRETARCSVIIVNYNGRHYLPNCLNSLLTDFDQNDEIILVDNASTDGSAAYVAQNFPTVRLVQSESNSGFSRGCNLGAQAATGRYLAFLNPDTVVVPGWLDALIDALDTNPGFGLATSKILLLKDRAVINTCGNNSHYTGLTLCRGTGQDKNSLPDQREVNAVSGAAFVIIRHVFTAVGGFDPTFFMYMEDTDLSWRARLAGYRCLYVPESVVYHDYTLRFGPQKTYFQERNRYLKLLKTLSWRSLLLLLPALLLAEIITWGFVVVRERKNFSNKLSAYHWIVTHWPEIRQSRKQTQRIKRISDRELLAQCTFHLAYEQTGRGPIAQAAHLVFDPLFFIWQRLVLALIR